MVLSASPAGSYYIYSFDGKLMAEYDMYGQLVRDYIYMGNQLVAEYKGTTYYCYTSDQVNSTRIVTNGTGAVTYAAAYDPYGGIQKTWIATYAPPRKFSGKERDVESGLDYFGARYYASFHYRWISPDPVVPIDIAVADPQAWNLYSYVRNNPIANIDPSGLYTFGPKATEKQKASFRDALSTAASHRTTRYYADLYGKEGEENGVPVDFKTMEGPWAGQALTTLTPEGKAKSDITFRPDLQGDDLAIAIVHEGSHVSTKRAYFAAALLDLIFNEHSVEGSDIDLTKYADEIRAYEASALAARALKMMNLTLGGFKFVVRGKIDRVSLNSFLAKHYGVTPVDQGNRFSK